MYTGQYLGGKVVAELEILEEGGHEHGGEEENDTPEEDIGNVGPVGAAGAAYKLSALLDAVLQRGGRGHLFIVSR